MIKRLYGLLLIAALIAFIGYILFRIFGIIAFNGLLLVFVFIFSALGIRRFRSLKGFSYTLWIFAAVSAALYYPKCFLSLNDFQLTQTITPLMQVIMFGMGSQLALSDLVGVIRMPKGVITGLLCQFTIMPVMGFFLASIFGFSPEIAAGVVLIGCSPSGMASNVMSFLAQANLALSVTLTTCATLLSPLMTPLLMKLFAGQMVEVNLWMMMLDIYNVVILPIIAGLTFNIFSRNNIIKRNIFLQLSAFLSLLIIKNILAYYIIPDSRDEFLIKLMLGILWVVIIPVGFALLFKYFVRGDRKLLNNILSFISMGGIAVIVTVITAAGRDSLMEVGLLLILACLLHNLIGYGLGYSISRFILSLSVPDCRTIAFEVGMQNGGLASALALQMGKIATVGLAPAVFGPMMNITGSSLAIWWRRKSN